jgi:hypothetical protein
MENALAASAITGGMLAVRCKCIACVVAGTVCLTSLMFVCFCVQPAPAPCCLVLVV